MTRATAFAPLLLVATLALAGCGDDDSDSADSPPTTQASSASPSSGGSDSSTPESSAAPSSSSASVTPATGERFDSVAFFLVVPDGWTKSGGAQSGQVTSATFTAPDQLTLLDLLRVVSPGQLTFEEAAKIAGERKKSEVVRQPDREVGGRQVFVFTGDDDNGTTYSVGTVTGQGYATIQLTFAPASVTGVAADPAAQQALVESILATVEWTD